MRFFISGELDSEIADAFRPVRQEVEAMLNESLKCETYGESIDSIALVPIVLGERFPGRNERRLIQHKSKTADYRLHIDYQLFRDGSSLERRDLLLRNILAAVSDIERKLGKGFDGSRLSSDVCKIFGVSA